MVKNLKIGPHKGLEETILRDLGKINIICGKNSSGKSTILEAIEKATDIGSGKCGNEILANSFYKELLNKTSRLSNGVSRNIIKPSVENAIKSKELWFKNEGNALLSAFNSEIMQISPSTAFGIDNNRFFEAYNSLFNGGFSCILIPAKRQLQVRLKINVNEGISSDGTGIENFLFYAKNQQEGDDAREQYDQILAAFKSISSGYTFDLIADSGNEIELRYSFRGENWRPANLYGLGLQDLLILLFFTTQRNNDIVIIEEPESHIHPELQKKFLFFMREKTSHEEQFFLSTHSSVFLEGSLIDRLFMTSYDSKVNVTDVLSKSAILYELGYSVTDNLLSDLVILVEGPSDKPVLDEFLIKMGLLGEFDIKIWPLGGDIMAELELETFVENHNVIALIDKDPGSVRVRNKFIEKCEGLKIQVHQLEGYSIENYFTLDALRSVFGNQIPETIQEISFTEKLETQIGINVKKNNKKIVRKMELADISNTDLYEFLLLVKKKCKSI